MADIRKWLLGHFMECYDPTIEDPHLKTMQIDDQLCNVEVLDTAGQYEYTGMWDRWMRGRDGYILVYSISSWSSFEGIKQFHDRIRIVEESAPIILVGNKCDVGCREVPTQAGIDLAKGFNGQFFEASAKTPLNVEKVFVNAVRQAQIWEALPQQPTDGPDAIPQRYRQSSRTEWIKGLRRV